MNYINERGAAPEFEDRKIYGQPDDIISKDDMLDRIHSIFNKDSISHLNSNDKKEIIGELERITLALKK